MSRRVHSCALCECAVQPMRLPNAHHFHARSKGSRASLLPRRWHQTAAAVPTLPSFCSRMLALAQALLAWSPEAAEALPALLASPDVRPPWLLRFSGGCYSLVALASLALQLRMQPATAFRITTACQLVFDVGRLSTSVIAADIEAGAAAGRQALAEFVSLLMTLQLEAVMACSKLMQQATRTNLEAAANVETAFARSTARPAVLVPWLAAMS